MENWTKSGCPWEVRHWSTKYVVLQWKHELVRHNPTNAKFCITTLVNMDSTRNHIHEDPPRFRSTVNITKPMVKLTVRRTYQNREKNSPALTRLIPYHSHHVIINNFLSIPIYMNIVSTSSPGTCPNNGRDMGLCWPCTVASQPCPDHILDMLG